MKKRLTGLLLAAVMILSLLPGEVWAVTAPDMDVDPYGPDFDPSANSDIRVIDGVAYSKQNNEWWAVKFDNSVTSVDIPEKISDTYGSSASFSKVTKICNDVFSGSQLTSVTIPSSVTDIGTRAFAGTGLEKVAISGTNTVIGAQAFLRCEKLKEVSIQDGVTEIRREAFSDCKSLESIIIPNTVTKIGDSAFQGCEAMTYLIVKTAYTDLEQEIPAAPEHTTIGMQAFLGCVNLQQVFLPVSAKLAGTDVFVSTSNLKVIHYGGISIDILRPLGTTSLGGTAKIHYKTLEQYTPGVLKVPTCNENQPPVYDEEKIFCRDSTCEKPYVLNIQRLVPTTPHTLAPIGDEVPATCYAEGKTAGLKCTVCGKEVEPQTAIKKLEHTYSDDEKYAPKGDDVEKQVTLKPATCKDLGIELHARWCSNENLDSATTYCSSAEEISAEHRAEHIKEVEDAKEAFGESSSLPEGPFDTDLDCGHKVEITAKITTHVPGDDLEETIITEPTCKEEGSKDMMYTCTVCHEIISEKGVKIPKLEHIPGEEEIKYTTIDGSEDVKCNESCVEITTILCKNCNDPIGEPTRKVVTRPHNFDETIAANVTVTKPASCETGTDGEKTVKCVWCKETTKIVIKAEHTFEEGKGPVVTTSPANCYHPEETVTTYKFACTVCGKIPESTRVTVSGGAPQLEHAHAADDKGVVVSYKAATCTENGEKITSYLCIHKAPKNETKAEDLIQPVPVTTNTPSTQADESTEDGGTESGTTEGGSTEGGSTEGGSTEGGSTEGGSTEGGTTEGGNTGSSTETELVSHWYTITETIRATGHKPDLPDFESVKEVIKEATCTEEGEGKYVGTKCSVCKIDLQNVTYKIPALGHDFGNWTTGSDGVRTRTCKRCGEVQKDSGSASGNTPSNPSNPSNPSTPSSYTISVIRPANGAISASSSSAVSGATVTLTFTPNAGYELDLVRVTRTSSGRAVTVSGTGNNRYAFIMPAGNVEVRATFTAIPGYNASASQNTGTGGKKREYTNNPQAAPQAGASAQIYADVPGSHWASGEIAWVTRQGYMSGSNNRFNPDGLISSQQLWMVLARVMGQHPASMTEARNWATQNGFAAGGNPNAPISRQTLMTALYRCARLKGSTNDVQANLGLYSDSRSVDSANRAGVAWAVANGLLSGTSDGKLNPTGNVNRAQAAVFLYRFYQRIL